MNLVNNRLNFLDSYEYLCNKRHMYLISKCLTLPVSLLLLLPKILDAMDLKMLIVHSSLRKSRKRKATESRY